jgi:predicted RNA binding protein YcfA (HicA-like mRNA interferase family)/predicted RNase H-like HicB family nuclease
MVRIETLTAIIEREGDGFVALCPELDVATQGSSVEEAQANLREAVELFFETTDASEIERRLVSEVYIARLNVARGSAPRPVGSRRMRHPRPAGFVEVRRRGSHIVMQWRAANTTTTVPVPDRGEIRAGTLLSIIRQSGLPRLLFESQ